MNWSHPPMIAKFMITKVLLTELKRDNRLKLLVP
jgi:hypothetical protein